MYFDFFVSDTWNYLPSLSIRTIYKLYTDATYISDHHIIDPDKFVFIYTMEGHGAIEVSGQTFFVGPSDLVFANTDTSLRYWCVEEKWNFWLVEFKTSQYLFEANKIYCLPFRPEYHTLFSQALEALKDGSNLLSAAYFQVLCCILYKALKVNSAAQNNLFSRCLAYMEDHLTKFTVDAICQDMNISRRTINNLFFKTVGVSPYQYYQKLRVERSKEYLENTNMSIAQIATHLGYYNSGHFSRIFKSYFDVTPQQYRAEFHLRS